MIAIGAIIAGSLVGALAGGVAGSATAPTSGLVQQEINKLVQANKVDPSSLIQLSYLFPDLANTAKTLATTWGYNAEQWEYYRKSAITPFNAQELISLKRRNPANKSTAAIKADLTAGLKRLGYEDSAIANIEEIYKFYPSVQDVIRFAVREVFKADIVQKYGYSEEDPLDDAVYGAEYKKILRINGVDETTARQYWRAHWDLPPLGNMFEALHRFQPKDRPHWIDAVNELGLDPDLVQTNVGDIKERLKIGDMSPRQRDRLVAQSFNNLLRVDIRRLVRDGVLDFHQCVYWNKANGNTLTNAKLLAKWSFVYAFDDLWIDELRNGLRTKADIYKELELWEISPTIGTAKERVTNTRMLRTLERKFDTAIAKTVAAEKSYLKSDILAQYRYSAITKVEAKKYLVDMGYEAPAADFMLSTVDIRIRQDTRRAKLREGLTQSQLLRAYKEGLITEADTRQKLSAMGEGEFSINTLINLEKRKKARTTS